MKLLSLVVLVAMSSAAQALVVPSDSTALVAELEVRAKKPKYKHRHDIDGVRPNFRKACVCAPDNCPSFLDKKSVCLSLCLCMPHVLAGDTGTDRLVAAVRMQGRRCPGLLPPVGARVQEADCQGACCLFLLLSDI